jgi:hypothetical protein
MDNLPQMVFQLYRELVRPETTEKCFTVTVQIDIGAVDVVRLAL